MVIEIENLTLSFGGLTALHGVSLGLREREILGLIGPNGAGKTSLFNVVTGIYRPTSGSIRFRDENISGRPQHCVAQQGIARTFQHVMVFPELTCLDNVIIGTHSCTKSGLWSALLRTRLDARERAESAEKARGLLRLVGLEEKAGELAKNLAYGEQRRLDIARALAMDPKALLLDEPAAGLNASERAELRTLILKLHEMGLSVILIDHDMKFVMGLVHRVVVLNYGEKIADGTPEEVQRNQQVVEAYLGRGFASAPD